MKILYILSVTILLVAPAASADPPEHILGGHHFTPSLYVDDPWTDGMFRNHTGGGMALGLETPFLDRDGEELFVLEGDVFYGALGLGYQYQLGDGVALGAKLAGQARVGGNTQSIVAEGANVDRQFNLWLKTRVFRNDKSQLTLGLDWQYNKTIVISPYQFALEIIEGVELDEAVLLEDIKGWTGRLAASYAHAFSPSVGLRASAYAGLYEVPFTRSVSKATHRFSLILEYDFNPGRGVPLGISLGRTQGYPKSDPQAGLSGTLLGFWYTGRDEFSLGVETGYMTLPVVDSDVEVDAIYGVFSIRYYF